MSLDITTPGGGGPVGPIGIDVPAMMRKLLAPYRLVRPWQQTLANHCFSERNADGVITKIYPWTGVTVDDANAVMDSIGCLPDLWDAQEEIEKALVPVPEDVIRQILFVMLTTLRGKPTEGAEVYIATIIFELTEPETGRPICASALAAAARETWNANPFVPGVSEIMARARKHQGRLETIKRELNWLANTYDAASDIVRPPKPDDQYTDDDLPF